MHSEIADKKEELVELCRRHEVVRLEVFGSAARGVDFDPISSDADFLVEFNPENDLISLREYFNFADALRETLDRPVDLVELSAIKNPLLRAAINKSRELIYES